MSKLALCTCLWVIIAAMVIAPSQVSADYVQQRKQAVAMVNEGKLKEARAAFVLLAEQAPSDEQKSDAYEQAALLVNRLDGLEAALETADQIPLEPLRHTCRIELLAQHRQWKPLVDEYGQTQIETWPDSVRGRALSQRGLAYYRLGDGERAREDLTRAADLLVEPNSLGLTLGLLGDMYDVLLKEPDKALETYRRAYGRTGTYKHCRAAISAARLLSRQGDHDQALKELDTVNLNNLKNIYYRATYQTTRGDILAASGKTDEARALYETALAEKGISDAQKQAIETQLGKLGTASK